MKRLIAIILIAVLGQALGQAAERFDFHTIRKPASTAVQGVLEGEFLQASGRARPQGMSGFGAGWSGDAHLLWDGVVGDSNTVEFSVGETGKYALAMRWTLAPDYGLFEVRLNGKVIESKLDLYSPDVRLAKLRELGELELNAGTQRIEIKLIGANAKASKYQKKGYLYGLDYLKLTDSAPKPVKVEEPEQAVVVKVDFAEARALMKQHCFRCHGAKKVNGKVNLEALAKRSDVLKDVELALHAAEALAKAEMPPENEPQPAKGERAKLAAFFEGVVDEYVSANTTLEPVVMRRLNRYEYNNAVRDLLELRGDIYPLPEKVIRSSQYFDPASGRMPAGVTVGNRTLGKFQVERQILSGVDPFAIDLQAEHGFNNQGEQLSIPPILLESLLKLGRSIVNAKEFDDYTALRDTIFKDNGKPVAKRLRPFLERAFRSPVDEATLARYTAFHTSEQKRTG